MPKTILDLDYRNFEHRLNKWADDTGYVKPIDFETSLEQCPVKHRPAVWARLLASPKWVTVAMVEDELGAWIHVPAATALDLEPSRVFIATKKMKWWVIDAVMAWVRKHASPLSAVLFVLTMSAALGWVVGIGLFVMLTVHELGHMYVANRLGVASSPPVFMPFVGAVINLKVPDEPVKEAMIGIGGPLIGGIFAMLVMTLAGLTGSDGLQKAASIGMIINLFNLLPVRPMDGGRILQVLSPWVQILGLAAMAALIWHTLSPLLGLMLILGIVEAVSLFKEKRHVKVPRSSKVVITLAYAVTMAALMHGLVATWVK